MSCDVCLVVDICQPPQHNEVLNTSQDREGGCSIARLYIRTADTTTNRCTLTRRKSRVHHALHVRGRIHDVTETSRGPSRQAAGRGHVSSLQFHSTFCPPPPAPPPPPPPPPPPCSAHKVNVLLRKNTYLSDQSTFI